MEVGASRVVEVPTARRRRTLWICNDEREEGTGLRPRAARRRDGGCCGVLGVAAVPVVVWGAAVAGAVALRGVVAGVGLGPAVMGAVVPGSDSTRTSSRRTVSLISSSRCSTSLPATTSSTNSLRTSLRGGASEYPAAAHRLATLQRGANEPPPRGFRSESGSPREADGGLAARPRTGRLPREEGSLSLDPSWHPLAPTAARWGEAMSSSPASSWQTGTGSSRSWVAVRWASSGRQ